MLPNILSTFAILLEAVRKQWLRLSEVADEMRTIVLYRISVHAEHHVSQVCAHQSLLNNYTST